MTAPRQTIAELDTIFRAGAKAAAQDNPSTEELTAILEKLDDAVSERRQFFTPENRTSTLAYYDFLDAWYENRDRFPQALNDHYDASIRAATVAIFDWTMTGFLIEAMEEKPDLAFLDGCLEDAVLLSCECGEEPERPFFCVPSHLHAVALEMTDPVEGLDVPEDVEYLNDRFKRFHPIRKNETYTLEAGEVYYA